MAIITIPTIVATGSSMRLIRGDVPLEFLSGATGVVQGSKAIWTINFPIKPLKIADARAWTAALVQLAKPANQFEITPPGWIRGSAWAGGTVVDGSGQLGLSLNTYSVAANTQLIGMTGDFFEVNGELKMLIADATTNATGFTTLNFEPALRNSPSSATAVDLLTPQLTARLMASVAEWSIEVGGFHRMTFDAVEYF